MHKDESGHTRFMQRVYGIRGMIINEQILIERLIDLYLSKTYGSDEVKATQLRDWVFTERIPFEPKIQIFKLTVEKYADDFKKGFPNYFADLLHVCTARNIFAHYLLINDDDALERFKKDNTLLFAKFKNDSAIIPYSHGEVQKIIDIFKTYIPALMELTEKG